MRRELIETGIALSSQDFSRHLFMVGLSFNMLAEKALKEKKMVMEFEELRDWIKGWFSQFAEDITKHLKDLPDTPDHILVILKGHLLVEQEINRLLEAKLPNPDAINLTGKYGPRFIHKLLLLKALIPNPPHVPHLWDLIEELSKLRNDFGHRLRPKDVEIRIDEFTTNVINAFYSTEDDGGRKKLLKKSQRERIHISLILIAWHLAYMTTAVMCAPST